MRELYNLVYDIICGLDFNEIWPGFHMVEFALYDQNEVYLKNCVIPYDNRFLGNTRIKYEGKEIAIWQVENISELNYNELAANIVHEMFHAFQINQMESRFPNDIKALSYPNELENYNLKYNENVLLVDALDSTDVSMKENYLKRIIASRNLRVKKFGSLINYEFNIETIEGSAEYCGTRALKLISYDLYNERIKKYKKLIVNDKKILFDIRRAAYVTGTLLLLLLDEIGIKFTKEITNQKLTIFEDLSLRIDTINIIVNPTNDYQIELNFNEEVMRKKKIIDSYYINNPIIHSGEFNICGYDPMNMFKLENQIYCSNFVLLKNIGNNNNIFIKGPLVIISEDDQELIKKYYTLV